MTLKERLKTAIGHLVTAGNAAGAIVGIIALSGLIVAYRSRLDTVSPSPIARLVADPVIARYSIISLFAATFLSVCFSVYAMRRESRIKRLHKNLFATMRRNEQNNREFMLMAEANSDCDKNLFDIFFHDLMRTDLPIGVIRQALYVVDENIEKTLSFTVMLFERITGERTAACVKLLDDNGGDRPIPIGDLKLRTLRRDASSRPHRQHNDDRTQSVRNNSADSFLFTRAGENYPNRIFVEDNLASRPDYHNERANWKDDYNATIVCGIRNLHNEPEIPWAGLLCIDNKGGGFNNEIAKLNIIELSSRLSVMIYRHELLEELLETASRQV